MESTTLTIQFSPSKGKRAYTARDKFECEFSLSEYQQIMDAMFNAASEIAKKRRIGASAPQEASEEIPQDQLPSNAPTSPEYAPCSPSNDPEVYEPKSAEVEEDLNESNLQRIFGIDSEEFADAVERSYKHKKKQAKQQMLDQSDQAIQERKERAIKRAKANRAKREKAESDLIHELRMQHKWSYGKCRTVILTGKNKGKQCQNAAGLGLCGFHQKLKEREEDLIDPIDEGIFGPKENVVAEEEQVEAANVE